MGVEVELHPEYADPARISNFHYTTNDLVDFGTDKGPITLVRLGVSPHRENPLCGECPRQWSCLMGDVKCEFTLRIWGHAHVSFYTTREDEPMEYVEVFNGDPIPGHYADLITCAEEAVEHPLGGGSIRFNIHSKPLVFRSVHNVGEDAMGDSMNRRDGDIIRIPNLEELYAYFVQQSRARYHPNGGVRADQHRRED